MSGPDAHKAKVKPVTGWALEWSASGLKKRRLPKKLRELVEAEPRPAPFHPDYCYSDYVVSGCCEADMGLILSRWIVVGDDRTREAWWRLLPGWGINPDGSLRPNPRDQRRLNLTQAMEIQRTTLRHGEVVPRRRTNSRRIDHDTTEIRRTDLPAVGRCPQCGKLQILDPVRCHWSLSSDRQA